MTLTEAQQKLAEAMSDASELAYCAGWMERTEYRLWKFLVDPLDDGYWGREPLNSDLRSELRRLSDLVGGWIHYRTGDDLPKAEWGCAFIGMADWLVMYEIEAARLRDQAKRLSAMPRRYLDYTEAYQLLAEPTPPPVRAPGGTSSPNLPDRASVLAAEAVIRPHIRETPVLVAAAEDFGLSGLPITFKLEFLQHSGTFKARGAFTNLLMREGAGDCVVAASGGNHGAAVAYAAMKLGHKARIYVPAISAPAKIARIKSYGAEVVVGGDLYADALAASEEWVKTEGGLAVHAFDQFETLAGQGTTALEFHRQSPELDTVLVAVGGGGLIVGMAAYYAGDVRLIGVEPELAPTLTRALEAGLPVDAPAGGLAADSLAPKRVGGLMFQLAQKHIARTVLVADADIAHAQRVLWDVLRVVAEPGGAAAFAALLAGRYKAAPGECVGILLCGANTSAVSFPA